jgi:uncharacterized membrane protein
MDVRASMARYAFRRRKRFNGRGSLPPAGWIGLGAGLMFLLDRDRGPRRRALLRDQIVHALRRARELLDKGARDLNHRIRGIAAELRPRANEAKVSDDQLALRVRAKMGRYTSHARAIEVKAQDGHVSLHGPILASEEKPLVAAVAAVPGVTSVDNHLEIHQDADGVPALQGGASGSSERDGPAQESWAPSTRLLALALAGGLCAYGLSRRSRRGALLGALGALVLLRDLANRPLPRLFGVGAGRRAIEFQKAVTVRAPVDDVFDFWMNFENFPRFMAHLKEVKKLGEGRYRWVAMGPAGLGVSWDAEVTQLIPNKVLAWRSEPGAAIKNAGVIRFDTNPDGSTRMDIRMSYNPPGGAIGHAVASLFGADPKRAMDEDLVRFQSILEQGKTTAHGEEVRFAEVAGQGSS